MSTWATVFLGVIAVSSVVQALFLLGLASHLRRLARRLDELQDRVDREVRPGLEELTRVARNLSRISDLAVLQARRVDDIVTDALDRIEETGRLIQRLILRPLGPLGDILAFLKGLKRGIDVYRQLGGLERRDHGSSRRYADAEDEHLFI